MPWMVCKHPSRVSCSARPTISNVWILRCLGTLYFTLKRKHIADILRSPGRMDVWIEFRNASKFQAEGLFRNFFPAAEEIDIPTEVSTPSLFSTSSMSTPTSTPATPEPSSSTAPTPPADEPPKSLKDTLPSLESVASGAQSLDAARLAELAKIFADSIPNEEFSVADLQGCESLLMIPVLCIWLIFR